MKKITALSPALLVACLSGCGSSSGATTNYPLFTPPVKAATPKGFVNGSSFTRALPGPHPLSLSPSDFHTRFFTSGPTDLFGILQSVDDRISGINSRASNFPCENTTTPVSYTISPVGQAVTMYAQCSETFSDGSGFDQFANIGNKFYIYVRAGDGEVAAIASPSPTDSTKTAVQIWASVGLVNLTGSHGVMEISADPASSTFEMTVAGLGMGYCGVQYKSDGTNIYGTGSVDMGSTCNATDTICVLASDATTSASCSTAEMTFSLPAIGRESNGTSGASQYPGGGLDTIVVLTTGAPDAVQFGPASPSI